MFAAQLDESIAAFVFLYILEMCWLYLVPNVGKSIGLDESWHFLEISLSLVLCFAAGLWLSLQQQRWRYVLVAVACAVAVATSISVVEGLAGVLTVAVTLVFAGSLAVAGAIAAIGAETGVLLGALFIATAPIVHVFTNGDLVSLSVAGVVDIPVLLGMYFGHRALKREEPMLAYLRRLGVFRQSRSGTSFAYAELQQVDFSGVDLRGVSLVHTRFQSCRFDGVRNHHLALTTNSPLAPRAVRRLVIEHLREETDFHALDLSGLDFSGLDLRGYNFSHANLSFANFSGCDLREADLSAVTAVGADFSGAKLTGACLENWNIDTETRLQDVNCDYYFYLDDGQRKRMPPAGEEYPPGEFSRIFQKLANTIDFIAHNEIELAAIQLAVEKVRVESDNEQVRVQTVEEKDGCIVVRVVAPKNEDRGALYHEVSTMKQEYENRILLLQAEKSAEISGLLRNINDMKEQLREQRQDFLAEIRSQQTVQIGQVSEVNMGNKINIQGNIQNSGVMNLGGTVGGDMTQTPASSPDLQAALQTLHALIATLKPGDQAEARQAAADLVQAEKLPPEEQQSTVRKTLRYFKGLAADLGELPDTASKLAEVAAKIALAFGLA